MTVALCIIAMTGMPCEPARGGHAKPLGHRGGHAVEVIHPVPRLNQWVCIHGHEAAWNDPNDPYWGGLQMDRSFMKSYGADMIRLHHGGLADTWTPREQMIVANRAYDSGRGYTPWPNTARMCHLL